MLDDSLPTYRLQPSSENPLNTLLYFTHNGSEPVVEYVLKRPPPATSKDQYALGLVDPHYASVIYGEVLVKPEWTQPSLSAAEARAQNGVSTVVPLVPEGFTISLYNPDQSVSVRCHQSKWTKSDSWEFEIPEQTFRAPSASQLDQETGSSTLAELTPKVLFRWKRDSKLSRDMTCYMIGRTIGGKKSKEPDITVAMYGVGKNGGTFSIYEPNMARVDVEDRKGLEVVFLLSGEVIKDLYLSSKHDLFNTSGVPVPIATPEVRKPVVGASSKTSHQPPSSSNVYASGALGISSPPPVPLASSSRPPPPSQGYPPAPKRDPKQQAQIDAETRRLQAMVADEERLARSRERRDQEDLQRIRRMLEDEENERRRRQAQIDQETERLRREYGTDPTAPSPSLPPRPAAGNGSWFGPPRGQAFPPPPRPSSVGPPSRPLQQQQQQQYGGSSSAAKAHRLGNALGGMISGAMGHSRSNEGDSSGNKVHKKRSVHF